MLARHNGFYNRICLLPMLPSRIAPVYGWLLGTLLDSGRALAAFVPGSDDNIRGRFWPHMREGVPAGT